MGALGILAAIAIFIGVVQTSIVVTEDYGVQAEATKTPVVEVQEIQPNTK